MTGCMYAAFPPSDRSSWGVEEDVLWTASEICHCVKLFPVDPSSFSKTKLRRTSSVYLIACAGISCGRGGISSSSTFLAVDELTIVHVLDDNDPS